MEMIRQYYYKGINLDLTEFYECCDFLIKNFKCDTFLNNRSVHNIIFEGSQGLLLDQDIGFFPNVTRSNTGSKRINKLWEGMVTKYFVTRAYQTRHGAGKMTNEDIPHNIKSNPSETNVTNKWQGSFRKSLLDLDLLQYTIQKDGGINSFFNDTLVITCLDHIENEYRFTHKGNIICCNDENDFVHKITNILGFQCVCTSRSEESKNIKMFKIVKSS
jgi:adenylosuccinate synthase